MLALVIDTSSERGVAAIVENGVCLYFAGLPFGHLQSRYLMPKVDEAFANTGRLPQELDFLAISQGPGSYTGIRIAATVGKTISYALKIPLVGVSSLEGFAPDEDGRFLSMMDAKMSGVYVQPGVKEGNKIFFTSPPVACPLDQLESYLAGCAFVVGPSLESIKNKITKKYPHFSASWQETAPDPLRLFQSAAAKYSEGKFSVDGSFEIFYLRDSS